MRRVTKQIVCGNQYIGGDAPVSIQSMTNTDTRDTAATILQIQKLEEAGCEIVRCAVPDQEAADAFQVIKRAVRLPVVADIHFDYRLAIAAIQNGADKVRINPGNIGSVDRVAAVVAAARDRNIPIRIGVNSGSIERRLLEKHGGPSAAALAESALDNIKIMEDLGYDNLVISLKASSVKMNYDAHLLIADQITYPLHIGITESGTMVGGYLKSAVGIGSLLLAGIGDTIRVSFTGDPINEIAAARELLKTVELRKTGINLVSCPTCGRCNVDLDKIVKQMEPTLAILGQERENNGKRPLTVAVMGCAVNGPGEAKVADIGIACGNGEALLFRNGTTLKTIKEEKVVQTLLEIIKQEA